MILNFNDLRKHGKTVIYKEAEVELEEADWKYWGKKTTPEKEVFVYRRIVTFEEAEQYELENEILN